MSIQLSDFNIIGKDEQSSMSTLYSEIARDNFALYKTKLNQLSSSFKSFMSQVNSGLDVTVEPLKNDKDFIDKLSRFKYIFNEKKTLTDNFLENQEASMEMVKTLIEYIDPVELKKNIAFDPKDEYLEVNEVIKCGITAIAFEAFACEAILNEKITKLLSRNKINEVEKRRRGFQYINKLREICSQYECKVDNEIVEALENLMRQRNKIAHFKEFQYDHNKMFLYFENNIESDNNENFYIGELFTDIQSTQGVFKKLKRFIEKMQVNSEI